MNGSINHHSPVQGYSKPSFACEKVSGEHTETYKIVYRYNEYTVRLSIDSDGVRSLVGIVSAEGVVITNLMNPIYIAVETMLLTEYFG
jgi:hypothetical protein